MNEDDIVKLELPLKEVNQILSWLGQRKYSQVAVIIAKLQTQTLQQVNPSALNQALKENKSV